MQHRITTLPLPSNALSDISVTLSGIEINTKRLQEAKALLPIFSVPSGMYTSPNAAEPANASSSISFRFSGKFSFFGYLTSIGIKTSI